MRVSKIFLPILILLTLSLFLSSCEKNVGEPSGTLPETPSEAVTDGETLSPDATEEVATEEISTSETTNGESVTEAVTTVEVTTEEVTTEEVTTEEVTTEEVTTEEVTTEEITTAPEPHAHIWGAWEISKPAGCADRGEEKRSCACGESEIRYTKALGHQEGHIFTVKKPTCTSEGYGHRICSRCTAILRTESIPKLEHTVYKTVQNATCTEDGFEKTTCKVCGGELDHKVLKATGHTEGRRIVINKLSCTEDGLTQVVCSACTAIIRTETAKAQGHIEGRHIPVEKATCTEDGEEHVICSVCTIILRTETVKAFGHTVGPWVTSEELSTDEISIRQKKCVSCGIVMDEETVKSLALIEAERVAAAVNAVSGNNSFTFAAMSDIHVDNVGTGYNQIPTKKSCEFAVRTLSLMEKMTKIETLAMLGDYTVSSHNYSVSHIKSDFEYVRELFSDIGDYPVAWVRGNHENNYYASSERPLTNDEIFEYIESNSRGLTVDPLNPKGGYGYIDFSDKKIRMIYLNTSDVYTEYVFAEGEDAPSIGVSSVQLRWLADVALDFANKDDASEWGIIVNSHIPLDYIADTKRVLVILEAYRNGSTGELDYVCGESTYSVRFDFSDSVRAEIICSIHGHIHNFKYDKISSSKSVDPWLWRLSVPNMCTLRENQYAAAGGNISEKFAEFDENGEPIYYTKCYWDDDLGTYVYDEDAGTSYCIFTVDRDTRTVYCHYVGTGTNRIIKY